MPKLIPYYYTPRRAKLIFHKWFLKVLLAFTSIWRMSKRAGSVWKRIAHQLLLLLVLFGNGRIVFFKACCLPLGSDTPIWHLSELRHQSGLENLPMVTQLRSGRAGLWPQTCTFPHTILPLILPPKGIKIKNNQAPKQYNFYSTT